MYCSGTRFGWVGGFPAIAGPAGAMPKPRVKFDNVKGRQWVTKSDFPRAARLEPGAAAAVAEGSPASCASAVAGGDGAGGDDAYSDEGDSHSVACSSVVGDSLAASSVCRSDDDDDLKPPECVEREASTIRDTIPVETEIASYDEWSTRAPGANISWFFGNWGAISNAKNPGQRERMEKELRHSPAAVICLAECSQEVQDLLE